MNHWYYFSVDTYSAWTAVSWGSGSLWVGCTRPWRSAGQRAPLCHLGGVWKGGNLLWPPSSLHLTPILRPVLCLEASSVWSLESTGKVPNQRPNSLVWAVGCAAVQGSGLPWVSCSFLFFFKKVLQQSLRHSMAATGNISMLDESVEKLFWVVNQEVITPNPKLCTGALKSVKFGVVLPKQESWLCGLYCAQNLWAAQEKVELAIFSKFEKHCFKYKLRFPINMFLLIVNSVQIICF